MGEYIPVDYTKIITIEPGKRFGKPCIRGLRMTVGDVLEYLAAGMSEDEILYDFPYLTRKISGPACFSLLPGSECMSRTHPKDSELAY